MSYFSIAGMQLTLSYGNNLLLIGDEIIKLKQRFPWVDMVVLSELSLYGPEKKYAEVFPSEAEKYFCQLAKKYNIWIIPGSQYEQVGEQVFNTTSVINNHGEVVERYRKIYPFLPYETGVSAGQNFVVFDVPQGRIGVAICYDLWFPEIARSMVCLGAEVLVYPTLTGTIDRKIELTLAQATAVINQCYVLAVNGSGDCGNGQSIMVAPEGEVIYQAGEQQAVFPIEIDFSRVRRSRERGVHGLGQPLKSFRDSNISFPQYDKNKCSNGLATLGKLTIPK